MRRQLTDAARECRSTTFTDARDQFDFIRRLVLRVAPQTGRMVRVELTGRDVVVTFSCGMGPRAA